MTLKLKKSSSFQIKENLDGTKENILVIHCKKCGMLNKNILNNKKCVSCFIENLYLNFSVGLIVTVAAYISLQYMLNKTFFIEILRLRESFVK